MDKEIQMFRTSNITAGFLVATIVTGCASMAVTDASLEDKTAFALGLEKGDFAISNRTDSGVDTNYIVKTKKGQEYRCYVQGTVSIMGRTVSDAVCNRKGQPARNPLLEKAGRSGR